MLVARTVVLRQLERCELIGLDLADSAAAIEAAAAVPFLVIVSVFVVVMQRTDGIPFTGGDRTLLGTKTLRTGRVEVVDCPVQAGLRQQGEGNQ